VLSASLDETVKLWDAEAGRELASLRGQKYTCPCTFAPDGSHFVWASWDGSVRLANAGTGQEVMTLGRHHGFITAFAFSPDGRRLFSASWDKTLKIWDVETGREVATRRGHKGGVRTCAVSPDGQRIVTASEDKTLILRKGETGERLATLTGHGDELLACAFSPDGRRLVSTSRDRTLRLWDVKTGKALATLEGHTDAVWACAFAPDGSRVLSGSYDKTLKVWDAGTGEELASLDEHAGQVQACSFFPDGRWLSASWDGTLRVWAAKPGGRGEQFATRHRGPVEDCAFSPDGRHLVSSARDGRRIWDAATGQELVGLTEQEAPRGLVPPSSQRSAEWERERPKPWEVAGTHRHGVDTWALSSDRRLAASAAGSRWSIPVTIGGPTHWLVDNTIQVWDMETGARVATLSLAAHRGRVGVCAFSPDATLIVSISPEDETVRVWSLGALAQISEWRDPTSRVLAYSPVGPLLAIGTSLGTVTLLRIENLVVGSLPPRA
jgi:WD40 repeat protein